MPAAERALAPQPSTAPAPRRIASQLEANGLVTEVIEAIDALEGLLAEETALLKAGRISQALDLTEVKSGRAGVYARLLQVVKGNAVALARFAPDGVQALKARHGEFSATLALNETVLATVRAVSESMLRELCEEAAPGQRLSTYGPGLTHGRVRPRQVPLALSVKL